jgi:hypothetical protein
MSKRGEECFQKQNSPFPSLLRRFAKIVHSHAWTVETNYGVLNTSIYVAKVTHFK